MIEREQRLQELEKRNERFSHILEQRRDVYSRVGTGDVQWGESVETDIRAAQTKYKLAGSIARYQEGISEIENEIEALTPKDEELIAAARSYQGEVETATNNIEKLRELRAHLPEGLFEKREEELHELIERPLNDPDLFLGLTLILQNEKEESENVPEAPFCLPDTEAIELEDDERKVAEVLLKIYKDYGEGLLAERDRSVSPKDLVVMAMGQRVTPKRAKGILTPIISNLREKFVEKNWEIVNVGRPVSPLYQLEKVEEPEKKLPTRKSKPASTGGKRRTFQLPDGEIISLHAWVAQVAQELLDAFTDDKSLAGEALIRKVWGKIDTKTGKGRLSVAISEIREAIADRGWSIPKPVKVGKASLYKLSKSEGEDREESGTQSK